MSRWRHSICDLCWHVYAPDREPIRLTEPELERCCFCGGDTRSGIYVREDPVKLLHCQGHGDS